MAAEYSSCGSRRDTSTWRSIFVMANSLLVSFNLGSLSEKTTRHANKFYVYSKEFPGKIRQNFFFLVGLQPLRLKSPISVAKPTFREELDVK